MFISRVMVSGAPLVCRVESTRWPVESGLDGDFPRFQKIADFADQNDVWILPEEGTKSGGKVQIRSAPSSATWCNAAN